MTIAPVVSAAAAAAAAAAVAELVARLFGVVVAPAIPENTAAVAAAADISHSQLLSLRCGITRKPTRHRKEERQSEDTKRG